MQDKAGNRYHSTECSDEEEGGPANAVEISFPAAPSSAPSAHEAAPTYQRLLTPAPASAKPLKIRIPPNAPLHPSTFAARNGRSAIAGGDGVDDGVEEEMVLEGVTIELEEVLLLGEAEVRSEVVELD